MTTSVSLAEVGKQLDVTDKDVREMRRTANKEMLASIARIGLPILTFFIGALVAVLVYEVTRSDEPYPYAALLGAEAGREIRRGSGWSRTITISIVTFIVGLLLAASATFGVVTMYGVRSR